MWGLVIAWKGRLCCYSNAYGVNHGIRAKLKQKSVSTWHLSDFALVSRWPVYLPPMPTGIRYSSFMPPIYKSDTALVLSTSIRIAYTIIRKHNFNIDLLQQIINIEAIGLIFTEHDKHNVATWPRMVHT